MKHTWTTAVGDPENPLLRGSVRLGSLALGVVLLALLPACSDGGGGSSSGGAAGSTASGGGGAGGTTTSSATGGTGGTTTGTGGSATGGTGGTTTGTGGAEQPYPPGPYGFDIGSTIANYAFVGFPAPNDSIAEVSLVHLGDFYNPTGQGTYPAGSPYGAGGILPRVLLLHAAAVWAGPCNFEAQDILPGQVAAFGGCLLPMDILMDGPTPGQAATEKNASNWAVKYPTGYPVVIDPADQLSPIFLQEAFPTNILIDTQTMAILDVLTGAPDGTYFQDHVAPHCQ